jgi:hypothetical protein
MADVSQGPDGSPTQQEIKRPEIDEPAPKAQNSSSSQDNWMEIRVQGKLPERRSNHASFVEQRRNNYLYIHGGRDLKEGALDNMWRINISEVQRLQHDNSNDVQWELITTKGAGPKSISHHQCICVDDRMILIGGQSGDDDNGTIYALNLDKFQWSQMKQEGEVPQPRDDHSLV